MFSPSPVAGGPPLLTTPSPVALAPRLPHVVTPRLVVEYVGFSNAGERREYRLQVREGPVMHHYTVNIPLAAFARRLARLQDGPDICYMKMQQEMLACGLEFPATLTVSDEELGRLPGRPRARPARPREDTRRDDGAGDDRQLVHAGASTLRGAPAGRRLSRRAPAPARRWRSRRGCGASSRR